MLPKTFFLQRKEVHHGRNCRAAARKRSSTGLEICVWCISSKYKTYRDYYFETLNQILTDSITPPQARGEVPRLPNGVPEKSSRPDRPRARDRPKPRRRPRPKEPGETTRRSRSAPAQSSPAVPQPPTHTAHHEGFLFRKLDIESLKKSTNRWVFRVIMIIAVDEQMIEVGEKEDGHWCHEYQTLGNLHGQIVLGSNVCSLIMRWVRFTTKEQLTYCEVSYFSYKMIPTGLLPVAKSKRSALFSQLLQIPSFKKVFSNTI